MRRRVVTAGCSLLAIAMMTVLGVVVGSSAKVYWARVAITLLPPAGPQVNPVLSTPPDLPLVAALLVLRLNDGPKRPISASREATLYGEGTREGHKIVLRNIGSQWQPIFDEPVIDIEVVGPTEGWVVSEIQHLYDRTSIELDRLQNELGADPQLRIRTAMLPPQPNVALIGPMPTRLLAASALLYAIAVLTALRYVLRHEE